MTARSPSAFFLSVLLHALFATMAVLTAWMLKEEAVQTVRIFELVAGEGNNFEATEAPALGTPGGAKVQLPEIPKPAPKPPEPSPVTAPPEPVQPAPSPVQAVPPPKVEPKPAETKIPDFSKQVKRTSDRKANQILTKYQKEQKAKEAAQKKAEEEARKKMSKAEFDRLYGNKSNVSQQKTTNQKIAKIDAEGIAKGVVGGSTANKTGGAGGRAMSREEGTVFEAYLSLINQKLRELFESPATASDKLVAGVQFNLAANGLISRVRITQSSGDVAFDQAVLAAFAKLPPQGLGPTPNGESGPITLRFRVEGME